MKIEAVIFDLDGVLADTVEFHYLSAKKVADKENVPFSRQMNQSLQGMNRHKLIRKMLEYAPNNYTDHDIKELGELKNKYYQELIETLTEKDVLPGMNKLLEGLKEEKTPLAVASSSSNAERVLKRLGIRHYFSHVVKAEAVKNMKPDPEIFYRAADALSADYENCAAIEDSESGIKAINATPMFSVGTGSDPAVKEADWYAGNTENITLQELKRQFSGKRHK